MPGSSFGYGPFRDRTGPGGGDGLCAECQLIFFVSGFGYPGLDSGPTGKAFSFCLQNFLHVSVQSGIRRGGVTRGRHPVRALEEAEPIAKKRGLIQYYERGPGMLADFSITVPSCLALVKIKRMRYIRCTPQWLDREAYDELAGLKMYPSSAEISRELWICSPDYCWRFFKVGDTGLCELGRDGTILLQKSPCPKKEAVQGRERQGAEGIGQKEPVPD